MKKEQVVSLGRTGFNASRIGELVGIHRDTARNLLRGANIPLKKGRPKPAITPPEVPPGNVSEASKPAIIVTKCPPGSRSKCWPHDLFIRQKLGVGMLGKYIWQEMVDSLGFTGTYDSVKRYVRKCREKGPEVYAVIPTQAGMEAQVDYGRGAPTKDPRTGEQRRPWLFSMKLSHSRDAFRKVVWKSSSQVWCQLHEEAFRYFGGVPRVIKLDNLKEGVIKADLYDPEINPLYESLMNHYGAVAIPCRVGTPRHKGKVESDIKYVQNALKGRTFESIEEQNTFLREWNSRWASNRIHGVTKKQVKEVFETEEKSALKPLPDEPFPFVEIVSRKVHPDGHILVDGAFYSAPYQYVGRSVRVVKSTVFLDIVDPDTGLKLTRHTLSKPGRYISVAEHLPDRKRTDRLNELLIKRAAAIGENTASMVASILKTDPYHSIRSSQGIIAFSKKYSSETIERAAGICIEKQLLGYRALKNILTRQPEQPGEKLPNLTQSHTLIREPAYYQLVWDFARKEKEIQL